MFNGWCGPVGKIQSDDPEEDKEQEELKSILNKIALHNQETLHDNNCCCRHLLRHHPLQPR